MLEDGQVSPISTQADLIAAIQETYPDLPKTILDAMRAVDREDFIPAGVKFDPRDVHNDGIINLSEKFEGASISQPSLIAHMLEFLRPEPGNTVLEIGTGSGYQAAILAHLVPQGHVYSIDHNSDLAHEAEEAIDRVGLADRVSIIGGIDGAKGWPEDQTFDRIIVAAAASNVVPPALFEQLKIGGIMVIPLTPGGDLSVSPPSQLAIVHKRHDGQMSYYYAGSVWFVPFVSSEKGGWKRDPNDPNLWIPS